MYARVVRFTDVKPERIEEVEARANEEQGAPEGVPAKAVKMLLDESQGTAVAMLFFETEEDMRKGGEVLDQMDSGETPGTRASVDQGEIKFEREAS